MHLSCYFKYKKQNMFNNQFTLNEFLNVKENCYFNGHIVKILCMLLRKFTANFTFQNL